MKRGIYMKKEIYKSLVIIPLALSLVACTAKNTTTKTARKDTAGISDAVNKPAASGEPDYATIVSPATIKEYFDRRTAEIENTEMKNKLLTYSQEEKDDLANTLALYLPSFWDGADHYRLDDALIAYEAALKLSYTSNDIHDDYHYAGYFGAHALLQLYGIEFTEQSVDDVLVGLKDSCIMLQKLGYLDENFNATILFKDAHQD